MNFASQRPNEIGNSGAWIGRVPTYPILKAISITFPAIVDNPIKQCLLIFYPLGRLGRLGHMSKSGPKNRLSQPQVVRSQPQRIDRLNGSRAGNATGANR